MMTKEIPTFNQDFLTELFPNLKKYKGVSRIRQPIESLFNWLQEKAKIQIASKVRSTKGLLIHMLGRLSAVGL